MNCRLLLQDLLHNVQTQFTREQLVDQVALILLSTQSDDEIQEPLLNLLGYEVLENDTIQLIIELRDQMKQANNTQSARNAQTCAHINEKPNNQLPVQLTNRELIQDAVKECQLVQQKTSQVTSQMIDCCFIPHNKLQAPNVNLVPITILPQYFQDVFAGITHFNAMQSIVYSAAYTQSQNLLISAPTSAGKTNVAMLCILRMIQQFLQVNQGLEQEYQQWYLHTKNKKDTEDEVEIEISNPVESHRSCKNRNISVKKLATSSKIGFTDQPQCIEAPPQHTQTNLQLNNATIKTSTLQKCQYLCIYLTPMKALASEITQKFKQALINLGLRVLECTGDEQPPQQMIDNANVLILTPEKYDVITRKINADNPIYLRQQLLIIDEIHLLGVPQRGPVLETIISRTKQAIEQYQTPVRVVGISATIPNYQDIASCLNVPQNGLFVFGDQFRPIPMCQFIVSVKELNKEQLNDSKQIQTFKNNDETQAISAKYPMFQDTFDSLIEAQDSLLSSYTFKNNQAPQSKKCERENKHKSQFAIIDSNQVLDEIAIKMCVRNAANQHPTLLFVHSRRGTVELARQIALLIPNYGYCNEKAVQKARDCEKGVLSTCISRGVGFHNAEMDKKYRQQVEQLFRQGELYVVVCTATLAWGVNLPSQTVIIRGTQVFTDAGKQDLDILDVKQIFGRAGRPQYTQKGEIGRGIILTTNDKFHHYVRLLNNESIIESHAGKVLPDILNSEIVLGNISTVQNALEYIRRTFYYIRIRNCDDQVIFALQQLQKAKLIHSDNILTSSQSLTLTPTELGKICSYYYIDYQTLTAFIEKLQQSCIGNTIQYQDLLDYLSQVPQFSQLRPRQDEQQELMSLSGSGLSQINNILDKQQSNRKTSKQLNQIISTVLFKQQQSCKIPVRENDQEYSYKANILIQSFINRYECKCASLIADRKLLVQQIGRISQALFEALLVFKRLEEALKMLDLVTSIMFQCWYDEQSPFIAFILAPIGQVRQLHGQYAVQLQAQEKLCKFIQKSTISKFHEYYELSKITTYEELMAIEFDDMKTTIGSVNAQQIKTARQYIPQINFDVFIAPISQKVLRVVFHGTCCFKWDRTVHGYSQEFLIAIARADNGLIIQYEKVMVSEENYKNSIDLTVLIKVASWNKIIVGKQQVQYSKSLQQLNIEDDPCESDEVPTLKAVVTPILWTGCRMVRQERIIEVKNIVIQEMAPLQYQSINNTKICFQNTKQTYYTPLPKLKPLSIKALHFQEAEKLFKFQYFNPIQTAMFHILYYNRGNVFVGAPTSCGKTIAAEIAMLSQIKHLPGLKTVYIAPIKALVKERYEDWKARYKQLGIDVLELTGESLPSQKHLLQSLIYIATPEKFDAISRQLQDKQFLQTIGLIILDEVHLIGNSRGYVLESIVARFMLYSKQTRIIGMSTASSNTNSIASWLNVPTTNIFNFDSNSRPVKLDIHIQGYIGEQYCPRMELMNKPVYAAIKKYSPQLPVLVFVSSRRQTRKTAFSLLQQSQQDPQAPQCFWKTPNDMLAEQLQDEDASQCLKYGIGIHHAAMAQADKDIVQELFTSGKITVLVCTSTMAWGINVPAYMTILKGCEFYDKTQDRYIEFDICDINQMCGRAGRPQFIQNRYYQWISEYFGDQLSKQLQKRNAFENMYRFNAQHVISFLTNKNDQSVQEILEQLEIRDQNTPQAVSIIMCKFKMKELYKEFISEPLPFESSLQNTTFGNPLAVALFKTKDSVVSHFPDVLVAEICAKGEISIVQLRNWLQLTFFFQRARCNPQLYGIDCFSVINDLENMTQEQLMKYQDEFAMYSNQQNINKQPKHVLVDFFTVLQIYDILNNQLNILIQSQQIRQCITEQSYLRAKYAPTSIGELTSKYYLSYLTLPFFMRRFYGCPNVNNYNEDAKDQQPLTLLQALCACPEFRQLAVRATEDQEMYQLSQQFKLERYPGVVQPEDFMSVEAKSFVLFQFQLRQFSNMCVESQQQDKQNKTRFVNKQQEQIQLPNADYYLDLHSLLENVVRIISAVIEAGLQTKQSVTLIKQAIITSQQLIQGAESFDDNNTISIISNNSSKKLSIKFIDIVRHFHGSHQLKQFQIQQVFTEFLRSTPNMQFQIYVKLQEIEDKKQQHDLLEIDIQFNHVSTGKTKYPHIFTNKFYPKGKQHTYYCILCDVENNSVIKYQKLNNSSVNGNAKFLDVDYQKSLRIVVESDLFLNLGIDVVLNLENITTSWQKIHDSFEKMKQSENENVIITID